ncbi:MAG: hypothetical protein AAF611_22695 [Bacteroidota bacterium]
MKTLKKFELSSLLTSKIRGGTGEPPTEEPPITELGTISSDGST